MTPHPTWTVLTLLKTTSSFFQERGIEEAKLNAEYLLAHVLGISRLELFIQFERPISLSELDAYRTLCRRKLKGEPLQYIIGECDFWKMTLNVNSSVLIPRPETEELVEWIAMTHTHKDNELKNWVDIGTGSGCIALSLGLLFPEGEIIGVDVSPEALGVARENAERTKASPRIRWKEANVLLESFSQILNDAIHPIHAIVSNPPYIPIREKMTLQPEVRDFEPEIALFAEEPFIFYERIFSVAAECLIQGGWVYLELHADGASAVEAMALKYGFSKIETRRDLSGIVRFLRAQKP